MTDIERGRIGGGDEDRLPWLEPVEDETPDRGVGAGKLIAAVVVCLLAIGLVIGGVFWLRERGGAPETARGDGDLIAAPAGDYKVAPAEPGGMNVEGEGDATFAASQGVPVDAAIDISKRPEAPVAAGPRATEPAKVAKAEPVKTVPLPASKAAAPATTPAAPVTKPATPVSAPAPKPRRPSRSKSRRSLRRSSLRRQAGAGEARAARLPSRPRRLPAARRSSSAHSAARRRRRRPGPICRAASRRCARCRTACR